MLRKILPEHAVSVLCTNNLFRELYSVITCYRERQDRLDRMREKIGSQMKEKEDDEDMRIKKAQKEMEEKQERELAEKLAKQRHALDTIAQHRIKEVRRLTVPRLRGRVVKGVGHLDHV